MRRATLFLLAACFLAAPAFTQVPSNAPVAAGNSTQQNDHAAIQQIEDDWLKAERNIDSAALDRILSDDFVNLVPTGLAPGKAELLKTWRASAGQSLPYNVETSDMHIYILGDSAVAAYTKIYTAKENGNVAHEATTHVFTKDHGTWKMRFSRATIPQSE